MSVVKAKCIWSSQNRYDSWAEFLYVEPDCRSACFVPVNKKIVLITENDELKLNWHLTIRSNCVRNIIFHQCEINLQHSDLDISVHICMNNQSFLNFESDSLPFIKSLTAQSHMQDARTPISVVFKIFYPVAKKLSSSKLSKFLENKELSDVIFVVEGKEIPAHRVIMAAHSDVFAKMFVSEMLEKNSDKIKIEDTGHKIFLLLLNFIYRETLETSDTYELLELLLIADRYSVVSLVAVGEQQLAKKISVDNVVDILIIADVIKLNRLKKQCLEFVVQKKYEVIKTQGYLNVLESHHADLVSELHSTIGELK